MQKIKQGVLTMAEILKKRLEIYSEKYNLKGEILDYGFVINLKFFYSGCSPKIALSRPLNEKLETTDEALIKLGLEMMETYVEKLSKTPQRLLMLHHWYLSIGECDGEKITIAHGIVSGHPNLTDSTSIHTSLVRDIDVDLEAGVVRIITKNSVYNCPLDSCRWRRMAEYSYLLPDFDGLKKKYQYSASQPIIEAGKMLLVLSNFDEYYFNSLYYVPAGKTERIGYCGSPHIGTYQDSYLIQSDFECTEQFDIRYFPHFRNIEFYSLDTDGVPLYIENIGDVPLYVKGEGFTMLINPNERKEFCKENAEEETALPDGDLYPTQIVE